LKIVQVSPYYSPHHGGVESFVRDISEEMVKRGHEVTVLTSHFDRTLPAEENFRNLRILRVPLRGTFFRTPFPKKLTRYLETESDIIHSHTPPPSFAYITASRRYVGGGAKVVTYHCDSDIPSRFLSPFIRMVDRRMSGRIIRGADRVIVTTETYASTSLNTWNIRPEIVPVSANTRRFFPDPEDRIRTRRRLSIDRYNVVLFVGRLVRHKGVQYLARAMEFLPDDHRLLIVGDGEYAPSIRRYIRIHSLDSRVKMIGDVPDAVLPSIYRASDVLVVPSTSRLEAFGISAIEAMASGTPVIVSDIPGVREIISDGVQGLRAEPMNPADIALKIRRITSDRAGREEMGRRCIARSREFSSSSVTDRLLAIYQELLASLNSKLNS
jgi:glycosyltransferase involved in cell wall biosynthesis